MKKFFKNFKRQLDKVPSLLVSLLVVCIISMNLLANKSVDTSLSWLGMDCGILFSALSFLAMDVITQCYGLKCANTVSIYALILSLFVSVLFFVASQIPGFWAESFTDTGGVDFAINSALNNTFKGTWYVIAGSAIAFFSSSLLNNFINYSIGKKIKNNKNFRSFALRTYVSTFIAQAVDNMIFSLLVSKIFFSWSFFKCFTCACVGAILELLFEIFLSPLGYKLSKILKKDENESNYILIAKDKEL